MSHIRKSFTSQFSKSARGHLVKLEDIEPIELKEGTKFCEFLGDKFNCCKNRICYDNTFCKIKNYRQRYKL